MGNHTHVNTVSDNDRYVYSPCKKGGDMLVEFGDEYRGYMKATKMFIPFIV